MNNVLALLLAAVAALSPSLKEWGEGPAQWIMTPEEQRAWRKVASDDEARKFVDLFWARRDPSAGTIANEFRIEFESRVAFSDKNFGEKRKRGAMTDRGRVFIVLGPATSMEGVIGQNLAQMGASDASSDPTGFREAGMNYAWIWEHADARKFDMPRIEVTFFEDPITRKVQRDPRKPDFGRAGPKAIRMAIVNPGLTTVPTYTMPAEPVRTPAAAEALPEAPAVASNAPGVSRLTLGNAESTFRPGLDVPWSVQFCAAKAEVPRLKYMLLMSGATEHRTREKDLKPERIAAQPGCYLLHGIVPVSKLAPGKYKLTVMIDDAVTGDSYDAKGQFVVE